jgi:hypothetical protein
MLEKEEMLLNFTCRKKNFLDVELQKRMIIILRLPKVKNLQNGSFHFKRNIKYIYTKNFAAFSEFLTK